MRPIALKLLTVFPVLVGVSLLTFVISSVLPGSAAQQLLGPDATPEQVARLEAELRLNRPAWERYWEWLTNLASGDLGSSITSNQPVTTLLGERLLVTLELVAYAFVLALAIAVPLALLAAHKPGGIADRLNMLFGMTTLSVASYVLALLLVLIFSVHLGVLPSIGFTPMSEGLLQNVRSLTLPALAIAVPLAGFYTRFLRTDLLDQMLNEDYVLTAAAKGIGPWQVLIRHAFRNSLFGLLTLVGLNFGALVGGTVIIEQIFAIPGMGQLLLQAINLRDVAVVQAVVLLLAVTTVLANLLVDALYTVLDPRIRHGN